MGTPLPYGEQMSTVEERPNATAEAEQAYFPAVDTHVLRSKHVKQTFRIQVMQPARKKAETTKFPVIYVTDGNLAFDVIKGLSYSMQTYERGAPRFIVVGIGYPDESPLAGSVLRARDLTFPRYPKLRVEPRPVDGVLVAKEGTKDFYGAEDFQSFMREELFPLIEGNYSTVPEERIYFGHSAGGGFGLFTLFTQAELFKSYLISSPGLIYHGRSSAGIHYDNYDFVLEYARQFIASGQSLGGVKLYMSVGTEEEFEPDLAHWQLTSSFYRMVALLRSAAIPGLDLVTEVFSNEAHSTVWSVAFTHGVRALFGTRGARRDGVRPTGG